VNLQINSELRPEGRSREMTERSWLGVYRSRRSWDRISSRHSIPRRRRTWPVQRAGRLQQQAMSRWRTRQGQRPAVARPVLTATTANSSSSTSSEGVQFRPLGWAVHAPHHDCWLRSATNTQHVREQRCRVNLITLLISGMYTTRSDMLPNPNVGLVPADG